VLLGIRALRDGGGARLIDKLHAAAPRPRVILVGVDVDTLPLSVAEFHADGYLSPDGETAEQLAVIIPPRTSLNPEHTRCRDAL
jgi:DNA-binding NarL/FixJ family response regulator